MRDFFTHTRAQVSRRYARHSSPVAGGYALLPLLPRGPCKVGPCGLWLVPWWGCHCSAGPFLRLDVHMVLMAACGEFLHRNICISGSARWVARGSRVSRPGRRSPVRRPARRRGLVSRARRRRPESGTGGPRLPLGSGWGCHRSPGELLTLRAAVHSLPLLLFTSFSLSPPLFHFLQVVRCMDATAKQRYARHGT